MLRLHTFNDIYLFIYYSSSINFLLNIFFLFHVAIAILLFLNDLSFKKLYSSKWLFYYFFLILFFFTIYYFSKFILNIIYVHSLDFSIITNHLIEFSYFSDVLVCLAFITSIISWIYLSERFLYKFHFFIFYFFIFILCTINMVSSTNLLIMFIFFEFIFLPSLFFVYQFAYSKKVDKTISYLLKWTLTGSFLVLLAIIYIYTTYSTLNIYDLSSLSFSKFENFFLFLTIFLGFGIKLPIWPFYYWLTKVHVEAPAGFSIFLSGFLVKTALYCLVYFTQFLNSQLTTILAVTIAVWGCIDASIRMWTSTDIKKLIAFATIQEMNLIVIFLFLSSPNNYSILSIFLLVHGVLSSLLFYLVDQIQKIFSTRNILSLSGIVYFLPVLSSFIWGALLIFRGFPIFIKFFIEWEILTLLFSNYKIFGFFLFLVISVFGVLGFSRVFFSVLYGQPQNIVFTRDILRIDYLVGLLLFFFLFFLSFLVVYF